MGPTTGRGNDDESTENSDNSESSGFSDIDDVDEITAMLDTYGPGNAKAVIVLEETLENIKPAEVVKKKNTTNEVMKNSSVERVLRIVIRRVTDKRSSRAQRHSRVVGFHDRDRTTYTLR